jgi:hypothetical protein
MMTNVGGKVFKNLRHEMFVHLLRNNASDKRVILCLKMQKNLKITMAMRFVFCAIRQKMS